MYIINNEKKNDKKIYHIGSVSCKGSCLIDSSTNKLLVSTRRLLNYENIRSDKSIKLIWQIAKLNGIYIIYL